MSEQRPPEPVAVAPKPLRGRGNSRRWLRLATNGLTFLVLVVVLGLSNVFVMLLDSISTATPMKMDDLFADGGLFFFAMTLLGGSLYSLMTLEKQDFHIQSVAKVMYGVFILLVIMSVTLTAQNDSLYLKNNPHIFSPNPNLLTTEKIAAALAVLFALVINLMVDDSANAERQPYVQADNSCSIRDGLH